MGYDYQIWIVDNPYEEESIRFSSTGVCKATTTRSSDFNKCFCIQLCDNRSQISVATIGEEPLNNIGAFVIDLPLTIVYYLLKLAELQLLGNSYFIKNFFFHSKNQTQALCIERKKLLLAKSYPGKLNQSDKHSPKDTICMFTSVERSSRQLRKLFLHLPVRTQQQVWEISL